MRGRARIAPRRGPLMLRTRFTVAVAAAVALVTLAITAVAFVVVRADLQDEVHHELQQQAAVVFRVAHRFHGHIPARWVPPHSDRFGVTSPYTQVVTDKGAVWAPAGDAGLLTGSAAAVQVAAGTRGAYYAEAKLNGVRAMVLTTPLAPGLAVQVAISSTRPTESRRASGRRWPCSASSGSRWRRWRGGRWPGPGSPRWPAWPHWPNG